MRKMCIMFDLENTLIDSWESGCVLHHKVESIRDILASPGLVFRMHREYGIFSFAIDNDNEKPTAKKFLFDALGFIADNDAFCPSFLDMQTVCRSVVAQKWELINIYGKDLLFPRWSSQYPDYDFVLIDDSLSSKSTRIERDIDDVKQTIYMIRV